MIVLGTVKRSDVTTGAQQLQLDLLDGETRDDVPVYEQAGVSFRAYADAEMLVDAIGGSESNLAAFGTSARGKRPTVSIQEGEGGLYFAGVFKVFLKNDGGVYLGSMSATEPAVFGNALKTEHDVHAHATPFGPTGAPIAGLTPACFSTIVKVS